MVPVITHETKESNLRGNWLSLGIFLYASIMLSQLCSTQTIISANYTRL